MSVWGGCQHRCWCQQWILYRCIRLLSRYRLCSKPYSSYFMSELMLSIQTRYVSYYSWGIYMMWMLRNASYLNCYWLHHNIHLYGNETANTIRFTRQCSLHHDSGPQWPCNGWYMWKWMLSVHSSVYGPHNTSLGIQGASYIHAALQQYCEIGFLQVQGPWCRLVSWATICSGSHRGSASCRSGLGWASR